MNDLSRAVKTLLIVVFTVSALSIAVNLAQKKPKETVKYIYVQPPTFEDLLEAIEWVESRNDPNAIGPDGEVGSFQLKKIYVDDVNRIRLLQAGGEKNQWLPYEYDYRTSRILSRGMVSSYLRYYATRERLGRKPTLEDMARIHNGGPNGPEKESTKPYWEKVKRALEGE